MMLQDIRRFNPPVSGHTAIMLGLIGLCSACAQTGYSPTLAQAETTYAQAQNNPQVVNNAPLTLEEARQSLLQAKQSDDETEVNHLSRIGMDKIDVAQAEAQQKVATAETQRAMDRQQAVQDMKRAAERDLARLDVTKTDRGHVMVLNNNMFMQNSTMMQSNAEQELDQLADFLKKYPTRSVLIEGYTDRNSVRSKDFQLFQDRVQAVRDFLLHNGVNPDRVRTQWYGAAYPVASNNSAAGRLQNRRVEIVISDRGELPPARNQIAVPAQSRIE